MLLYNTQLKKLILPEYGRNIQKMVDHCLTIQDREERTRCARTIVATMATLFPEMNDVDDYKHKFWDHLAIMADFKLDVDYPCEIIPQDDLNNTPERVPYMNHEMRFRHYGKDLERMIGRAAAMEEGEERTALIRLLANHMKKLMLAVNKDGVSDEKIFKDLYLLSNNRLHIDPATMKLHEFKEAPAPASGKKKKKKKKSANNSALLDL
ncbi:MAG: DUF4290 domain-containing protein [Bacteroidales bacterium]|nr:DUF4290 domain-containing protein [Bacteroidales bacterium]